MWFLAPDLNSIDFSLWTYLKTKVHRMKVENINRTHKWINVATDNLPLWERQGGKHLNYFGEIAFDGLKLVCKWTETTLKIFCRNKWTWCVAHFNNFYLIFRWSFNVFFFWQINFLFKSAGTVVEYVAKHLFRVSFNCISERTTIDF